MKRRSTTLAVLVLACLMLLVSAPVNAQEATPPVQQSETEAVYRAAIEAFNAGDLDAGMALYADDAAKAVVPPPPPTNSVWNGTDEIRSAMQMLLDRNGQWRLFGFDANGETATFSVQFESDDFFKDLNLYPLEFTGVALVRNGRIQSDAWSMTKATEERIDKALALEDNKAILRRFYDEIWNEGDMAVADEIIAVDFIDGFTGNDGVDGLKDIVSIFRAAYPDFRIEYGDMIAEGDLVAVTITTTGTYAGGAPEFLGIPDSAIGKEAVLFSGVDYAQIEDGQMVKGWGTHDELTRLLELGYEVVPPAE